jgi:hypothetical protein
MVGYDVVLYESIEESTCRSLGTSLIRTVVFWGFRQGRIACIIAYQTIYSNLSIAAAFGLQQMPRNIMHMRISRPYFGSGFQEAISMEELYPVEMNSK